MSNTSRTVSLKLSPEQDERLTALAKRRGMTRSELIRTALDQLSEGVEDSFATRAADLAGCAEGPKDLSTGPRHMAGYGK